MRNPFRSEADAFAFLLLTIVGFAIIAAASLLGGWKVGVPVWILVTIGFVVIYFRGGQRGAPEQVEPVPHADDEHRILVIANETVVGEALIDEIQRRSWGSPAHVLVVAPALNSQLRHWTNDDEQARDAARYRLDYTVERLRSAGLRVQGRIGDDDPLQAIGDACHTFGADEIIISTHPEGRSNWLEKGVVDEARERFKAPITHVVVDLEAHRETVRQ
jgi:hypothetical protein